MHWLRFYPCKTLERCNSTVFVTTKSRARVEWSRRISTGIRKFAFFNTKVNFSDILSRSYCVVNHSSNPALEAVINGINVFTGTQSFAYPMSMKHWGELNDPPHLDRNLWLQQLTHIEWWPEEIAEGKPWNRLKNYLW